MRTVKMTVALDSILSQRFHKGSIFSPITDALGLTNTAAEEEAARQADLARQASTDLGKEGLAMSAAEIEFQREQYYDWQATYGTIEDQLGSYYAAADAEFQVAQQLQEEATQSQEATKGFQQQLAQRGISGSGIEAAGLANLAGQSAQSRAGIRASADEIAANERMNFLGLGLGQGTQMLGINQAASSTAAGAATTLAGQQMGGANSLNSLQGQFGLANMDANMQIVGAAGGYAGQKGWI